MKPACYRRSHKDNDAGKHPVEPGWQRSATASPSKISAIWSKYPHANLGVRTGSGLMVLDVDPRNGGEDSFYALQERYGALPDTLTVATGGGGWHYYFRYTHDTVVSCDNRGKLGAGIDIKGSGGFVVGPGSRHASGGRYEFEAATDLDNIVIADAPAWLLERLKERTATKSESKPEREPGAKNHRPGFPSFIPRGQRHDFLLREAQFYRDIGLGRERTALFLRTLRDQICEKTAKHPVTDKELHEILTWTFEKAKQRPHRKPGPSAGALRVLQWLTENSHSAASGMRRSAATIKQIMSGAGLSRWGVQSALRSLELRFLIVVETCTGHPNTYLIPGGA